ncbi:hypothetical protein QM201_04285 [Enterobacter asburiae]|nr:hypothetical protein [Enterobacter asburiae]
MKIYESGAFSREEANALIKAILYIKFTCHDPDSLLYSGSPLINSALDKLFEMHGHKADWDKVFDTLPESNKQTVLDKIKLSEMSEEQALDEETRRLVINCCLHPYEL